MIIRNLDECKKKNKVDDPKGNWNSVRMLLKADKMGFSFHITTIYKDKSMQMHYINHLESVYCIAGKGLIKDLTTGDEHKIYPGMIYALDQHDKHELSASEEMTLACVFNPPISGNEVHNENGAYELD